jgi:hypothetical protein
MTSDEAVPTRLCPGQHWTVDAAPALRPDEYLCRSCVGRAMGQLERLSALMMDLEVTATRQSVVRMGGTAGRRRRVDDGDTTVDDPAPAGLAREIPLVFNEAAAKVRRDVEQRLIEWAEAVADALRIDLTRAPADPFVLDTGRAQLPEVDVERCLHDMPLGTCAACRGLPDPVHVDDEVFVSAPRPRLVRRRASPPRVAVALAVLRSRRARNWYRTDEQGPGCAQAIGFVTNCVRSAIDRYDRRWYAGECGQPITVVDLVEDGDALRAVTREDVCRADLYAKPGVGIVTCDGYREPDGIGGCGALHPAVTRHRYVLATLRAKQLPLDAILSVVPSLIGGTVPEPETVRQWRHRGKLRPLVCLVKHRTDRELAACRVHRREVYDSGQVLDLILASRQRSRTSQDAAAS